MILFFAGNFGKSIALFIPTWLCLYSTNLYALNYFALPSTYQTSTAILYGIYCIGAGLISYLLLVGFWWMLLSVFWRSHPSWISPKSWKNIFINWAIATGCLFLAFLFEPSLWRSGNVLLNGAILNSQEYLIRMITSRFSTVFVYWLFFANTAYLLKGYLIYSPSKSARSRAQPHQKRSVKPVNSGNTTSRAELRLSAYLFYDEKQTRRLVDGVQARYPDMPREWCAEKALSDLERDRQI